ncbi:hypothetical protein CNMCM5793_009254 [Aspergillus hiratsukae]|uniref:Uncharacterized protein n=1 Tax=Aspergillus hiratsukae TaxID=1194566 RepID=A0A8H6P1M3_9EURO|nr:hypothetical protein CNMCM5793_009254 [Aspergillus hiratsukae]KAF7155726.1 hypothetical protein CNMCM6106_006008 [Aspergillus hiratsukae]
MIANPSASGKPTILCIPRELRDIIIEYCFLERDPVSVELPNYPSLLPGERLVGNKYAPHEQLLQHYPLLMVNHQFRTEGWEVLSKLAASRYQVDILLYQRQRLVLFMPTPKIPTRFEHVHTKFYVVKNDGTRRVDLWHNRYRWGDGGPVGGWDLYRILELFLQCGPVDPIHAPTDAHILIGTLDLDVCTRTGIPENLLGPPNLPTEDTFVWPRIGSLNYLTAYLYDLFKKLLFYPEGRVIFERVGVVRRNAFQDEKLAK